MNKKIWITGASSGIGRALALKFAKEGWQVAASARRKGLLEDLNKNNSNIHSFPLDIINLELLPIMKDKIKRNPFYCREISQELCSLPSR